MAALWTARKFLAASSSLLIVLAYVVCIGLAKARNTYTGGLAMPYFSDIGRDKETGDPYPQVGGYYIFAVFISVASGLMFLFMGLQYVFFKEWFRLCPSAPSYKCRLGFSTVLGLLAPIGSALLAIFDTSTYPDLHAYSAYVFFVFIVLFSGLSVSLYRTLAKECPVHRMLLPARYVTITVLALAFILYIPVGLALASWVELSLAECVTLTAPAFCEAHVKPGTNMTDLWDYTETEAANLMRSSTQFICVMSIMVLIFLHALDPNPVSSTSGEGAESRENLSSKPITKT